MQYKGWRFEGNERTYLDKTLQSGFSAGSSGTMNEKLERAFAEKHNRKGCGHERIGVTQGQPSQGTHPAQTGDECRDKTGQDKRVQKQGKQMNQLRPKRRWQLAMPRNTPLEYDLTITG